MKIILQNISNAHAILTSDEAFRLLNGEELIKKIQHFETILFRDTDEDGGGYTIERIKNKNHSLKRYYRVTKFILAN